MFFTYSGTAPYGHFGNTVTSLLGPLFFAARQNDRSFSLKKKKTLVNTVTSVIRPNVFGPLVTVLTGFRTKILAIASCYQTSKVPSRNFGGRQFFVRQEILCSLTAVPRQFILQKNFLTQCSRNATLTQRFPRLSSFLLVRRTLRDHTKNDSDRRLGFA